MYEPNDEESDNEEDFLQSYMTGLFDEETPAVADDLGGRNSKMLDDEDRVDDNKLVRLSDLSLPERIEKLPHANETELVLIIKTTMGSMAQCRGGNGKKLHEAGAVAALTQVVLAERVSEVAYLSVLYAIRDLACGNPAMRADFYPILPRLTEWLYTQNEPATENQDDDATLLKKNTALMGALRNLAHSNGRNGRLLHELKLTEWLVKYIRELPHIPLPEDPDRELYFRVVGTLLGIIEKVDEAIAPALVVLDRCRTDKKGSAKCLYHPGLLKLIRASHEMNPRPEYAEILDKEAKRQTSARLREEQRKAKLRQAEAIKK